MFRNANILAKWAKVTVPKFFETWKCYGIKLTNALFMVKTNILILFQRL